MFNNNKERDNMNNPKHKVFLIIKKTYWSHDGETWFDVSANADTKEKADRAVNALNVLNHDKKVSYLISEVNYENK